MDACLYPIAAETPDAVAPALTGLYLAEGYVEISWAGSPNAIGGTEKDGVVELYDEEGRHAGTLVCGPGWEREKTSGRTRVFGGIRFASYVCWTIPYAGVTSLYDTEEPTNKATRRNIVLQGDGCVVPKLEQRDDGTGVLSFDVQAPKGDETLVRQLVVIATGTTPFSAEQVNRPDNVPDDAFAFVDIEWMADGKLVAIGREDICFNAHKEDGITQVVDTCENPEVKHTFIPLVKQEACRLCPDAVGAVNIITPDTATEKNAVRTEVVSGKMEPTFPDFENANGLQDVLDEGKKAGLGKLTGNGLKFSIPGLG